MTDRIPDLNFGDLFDALAPRIPEREAIVFGDTRRSWREFDARSNRLARSLLSLGLKPGSKVAFYLRNTPAYVELFSACAKARLVHANVNYRYVDDELFYLIDNSDAELVVYNNDYRQHVDALKPRCPNVLAWIDADSAEFEHVCTDGDDAPLTLDRDGIARAGTDQYFMYTGGTTGYPKAVMWQHRDRIAVIGMASAETAEAHAVAVAGNDAVTVAMPLAPLMHSTGLTTMLSTLCAGGTVVLLPTSGFDAAACLNVIEAERVERLAIVGDAFSVPLLQALHDSTRDFDLSSVNLISSAGAMWSEQHKQALLEYFRNATLSDSLGSSEGSRMGAITTRRGETTRTGRFMLGPNTKVFTEDFQEVEPGSGEAGMLAKGGPLPLGYYKDPERTEKTFPVINGERYSLAGDWCRIEADGTLTLLGRGNHCINTGGEKVYPEEVEDALKQHGQILDAAVLGVTDERFGSAVAALIKTEGDRPIEAEQLRAHLESKIARYKHPRAVRFTTHEFRHPNGKINYRAAREIFDTETGNDEEKP